jgi:hypothetical protein
MNGASLRRCWLWLSLLAFAACLNPQPDDNPMAGSGAGKEAPAAVTGNGSSAPEGPMFGDDLVDQTPTTSQQPAASGSGGAGSEADAGAPTSPDGGTPESDAGGGVGVAGD